MTKTKSRPQPRLRNEVKMADKSTPQNDGVELSGNKNKQNATESEKAEADDPELDDLLDSMFLIDTNILDVVKIQN